MNILVTADANYLHPLAVMLHSLSHQHPNTEIQVYLAHSSLSKKDLAYLRGLIETDKMTLLPIRLSDELLENAPVTRRYPREMYYRIFAAQYLPEQLERILYLDPDIVIINPINELYNIDFEGNLFAAATHIRAAMRKLNEIRLAFPENGPYINSGVMMMNLTLLRQRQDIRQIYDYIEKYRSRLFLPDQDIISSLYGNQILLIDAKRFNLTERVYFLSQTSPKAEKRLTLEEIRAHTSIIHYCGKNKPWHKNYHGKLHIFYRECAALLKGGGEPPARERLLLMVNPHAGKGTLQSQFLLLVDHFVKNGYDVTVRTTQRPGELPEIIRNSADDYDLLAACGGDGTLNEAVTGIMRYSPDSLFGYIPAGTVNDFAFSLHLPRNNILEAAEIITNGSVFHCDIGTFDRRYFTYVAAFGAFTDVSYSTPQDFKNLFGKTAYFLQGVSRLASLKSYHVRFETDRETLEGDYIFGMISNTMSVAGISLTKKLDVSLNDGELEILLVKSPANAVEWQATMASVLAQNLQSPHLTLLRARHISVYSPEPIAWTLDGEFGGEKKHAEIGLLPGALHILVPRQDGAF